MIRPQRRWLALPDIEALLGGDPANREAIVEGCLAGEINSRIKTNYGTGRKELSPLKWSNTDVDWENSIIRYHGYGITMEPMTYEWDIELDRESVLTYFGLNKQTHPTRAKGLGGRPPKYDWESFLIELAAHVVAEGPPRKQSELEGRMLQWCSDTWGDQPSVSEVRKRVSKALRAIEARLKT